MNWRQHSTLIGETKVFSEGSVESLIEMVIDGIPNKENVPMPGKSGLVVVLSMAGLKKELRAKWLEKKEQAVCPKCGDPVMGDADGLCSHCV